MRDVKRDRDKAKTHTSKNNSPKLANARHGGEDEGRRERGSARVCNSRELDLRFVGFESSTRSARVCLPNPAPRVQSLASQPPAGDIGTEDDNDETSNPKGDGDGEYGAGPCLFRFLCRWRTSRKVSTIHSSQEKVLKEVVESSSSSSPSRRPKPVKSTCNNILLNNSLLLKKT